MSQIVIVTDYSMPGMTGIDLLQQARQNGADKKGPPPAILFSGTPGLESAARVAGFQMYMMKPLDPSLLASEIARLTTGSSRTQ